jgi:imidazoleglycerol-phosphate dehydratase
MKEKPIKVRARRRQKAVVRKAVTSAPGGPRRVTLHRTTRETDVQVSLDLDGSGASEIATGIGFFDHMLTALAAHARLDLKVTCRGDLHVDAHHSVEDVGIVLGNALALALGDKQGLVRFGHAYTPLDEALGRAVIDLSGRPYLVFEASFPARMIGALPTELIEEFFRAFAVHGRLCLHLETLRGRNSHHIAEALFKAFAKAVDVACQRDPRVAGRLPTTKGKL